MTLSLRIDVDVPFGYYNKLTRMNNRLLLNYGIMPRWNGLGYLKPARNLRDFLHDNNVAATWFFGTFSIPNRKEIRKYLSKRGSINIHSERTKTLESFQQELAKWETQTGHRITGFTKHGSGDQKLSRYHDSEYDTTKLHDFAIRRKLQYFIGNGQNTSDHWIKKDCTVFVPSVFWLDRMREYHAEISISNLVKRAESEDIIALIHPVWWSLRSDLQKTLLDLVTSTEIELIMNQIENI